MNPRTIVNESVFPEAGVEEGAKAINPRTIRRVTEEKGTSVFMHLGNGCLHANLQKYLFTPCC